MCHPASASKTRDVSRAGVRPRSFCAEWAQRARAALTEHGKEGASRVAYDLQWRAGMKHSIALTSLAITSTLSGIALAESTGAKQEGQATVASSGAHTESAAVAARDTLPRKTPTREHLNPGLVLNVGFGFGGVTDIVGTASDEDDDGDMSQITGMATVAEIMLGGTLTPDWVLGGGIWASRIASTNYFHDHGMELPDPMRQPQTFVLAGPFVDWYFLRGTGLHAQLGLGFSMLTGYEFENGEPEHDNPGLGGGLVAGFGYDTWVAEHWRIGVLARITGAVMAELEAGETWIHSTTTFPALALTATYN
jgi:hypothetical protein